MASTGESFGLFWNDENGDRTYDASSFEYWLKKFFTSGVFNGDLEVQATSGMTLQVGSGYTNVDGKVKFWNGEFAITLDAANSTYPRIDTIVITRDNVNREIRCEKVTGAYSVDVPQPTAPVRNSEIYQLVIAQVYVPAGATGITQSNITDTRPDPELCGYITGTVTEMDFSQFSAQFAAYYNEFVNGHETDFDNWEATQRAAYAAWYAEVVEQMQDDHEAFNEWFENLQNQLDTDQLTHLQAQIDDIYTMLPAGSHITVTTEETTLHSMDVSITDGEHTITSEFDNNGVAIFKTLPYVGNFIIASTDGNDTAHTTITIPYYGRYAYEIAFWNAFVDIDGGEALAGAEVVVTNSEDAVVATVTLNAQGLGTFNAKEPDYYTFTAEYTGGVAIAELDVQEQMRYSLTMYAGWKTWVELGGLSPSSYETLEDVFDDEVAVRRLMTIHASADYLIAMASADITILDDFVANDTAMKWIGLRDYVCDGLTNIAGVEAMFMASDYWERYLKDHVPVMTSNTAPYGTASGSSIVSGSDYFKAFDGDDTSYWYANATENPKYLQYRFTNPTNITRVKFVFNQLTTMPKSGTLKGSNDGTNFTTIGTFDFTSEQVGTSIIRDFTNSGNYYLYYRAEFGADRMSGSARDIQVKTLQFYGRSLNVSVPIMTSNTAPYGEASANERNENAYRVFDKADTGWMATENHAIGANIGYDFKHNVCIKKLYLYNLNVRNNVYAPNTFKLQGSNDGETWEDIGETLTNPALTIGAKSYYSVDDSNSYKQYRIYVFTSGGANGATGDINKWAGLAELQFYGVDYSEREFETGSTMKYLYDHGLELETLIKTKGSSTASYATSEDSQMYIPPLSGTNNSLANFSAFGTTLDLTPYSMLRACVGDKASPLSNGHFGSLHAWNSMPTDGGSYSDSNVLAALSIKAPMTSPYNDGVLDVTSINTAAYVSMDVSYTNGMATSATELWLE